MKPELAIIGYGRFGRLAAHHLRKYFRVCVADRRHITAPEAGVGVVTIECAAQKPIIILAVPAREMRRTLKIVAPLVKRGSLICDTCSVKELPVRWLKEYLPRGVSVFGSHPLFGPSSGGRSVRRKSIVVCPVRLSSAFFRQIVSQLERRGLLVRIMTPSDHDRLMARSLFITQYVGRAIGRLLPDDHAHSTDNFKLLATIVSVAKNESPSLIEDLYRYNRYARSVPYSIAREFKKLNRRLARSYVPHG